MRTITTKNEIPQEEKRNAERSFAKNRQSPHIDSVGPAGYTSCMKLKTRSAEPGLPFRGQEMDEHCKRMKWAAKQRIHTASCIAGILLVFLFSLSASPGETRRTVKVGHGMRDSLEQYYDYLLMREAFRRAGCSMEVLTAPFSRILFMAKNGELDAVCNTLVTPERRDFLEFPKTSLVEYRQSFFVLKDSDFRFDGDLSRLNGRTIGAVKGFSYGAAFDELMKTGDLRIEYAAETKQLARMLIHRRVSVIIENPIALVYETRGIGGFWTKVREVTPPVSARPAYVAFAKKRPGAAEIMAAFDRALAAMKEDGTYDRIMAQALKRN